MGSWSSAAVEAGLRRRSWDAFDEALDAAVSMGAEGDRILAGTGDLTGFRRTTVAAALGHVNGPHGGGFLRRLIVTSGPGTSDTRCAAVLALAKREHGDASDVLVAALGERDAGIRDYALLCLAAYGDGRGRDAVLTRLQAMTARQRKQESDLSSVTMAVIYLLWCAQGDDTRVEFVRSLLARRFTRLTESEQRWLTENWPGAANAEISSSSNEGPPDAEALRRRLLSEPLFSTRR